MFERVIATMVDPPRGVQVPRVEASNLPPVVGTQPGRAPADGRSR